MKNYASIIAAAALLSAGINGVALSEEQGAAPDKPAAAEPAKQEQQQCGRQGMSKGMCAKDCLKELDITDDQALKLQQMRFEKKKKMIEISSAVKIKRLELQKAFSENAPDETINAIASDLGRLQADKTMAFIGSILAARTILTEEQWKKMQLMRAKKMCGKGMMMCGGMGKGGCDKKKGKDWGKGAMHADDDSFGE